MQKKIFYSIFASCLALLIVGNIFLIVTLESFFTQEVLHELKKEANLLAHLKEHLLDLKNNPLPSSTSHRISLIDEFGEVIYDSLTQNKLPNHANREEFIQALQNGESFSQRYSTTLEQTFLYYAIKITLHDQIYILRLSTAKSDVFSLLHALLPFIILEMLLCLGLCLLLAKYLTNSILKPIYQLDMKHLKKDSLYEELHAFVDKIKIQNKTIKNQFKKINQKQQELFLLAENMSDGLILLNHEGRIISFNKSANQSFPNLDKIPDIMQINHSFFLKKILFLLQYFKQNKSQHHLEYMDLHHKKYEIIFSPIYPKNKLKGIMIILRNMTKEQEMQQLRKEFSANVTHELKTPLTSILASSEMIKNKLIPSHDLPHFIDKIHQESKRLLCLIEEILKLTFFDEKSSNSPQKTKVSLTKLALETKKNLEILAKDKEISFFVETEECFVFGVEEFLQNLISNLCGNGIKYNKKGGFIKLSLKNTPQGVMLSVKDNGIGIPKQAQERIFERFYCVDKSRSKQLGGTGLGLSIVKSIANYHQATIKIYSQENIGSEFQILFPNPKSA